MLEVEALSSGPEVAALAGTRGRVLAVLRNAVYLASDAGYVAGIGGPEAPDGPLSLRVADLPGLLAALAAVPPTVFWSTDAAITIGAAATITGLRDHLWQPVLPQAHAPVGARARAAATLRRCCAQNPSPSHAAPHRILPLRASGLKAVCAQNDRAIGAADTGQDPVPSPTSVEELGRRRIAAQLAGFQAGWIAAETEAAGAALIGLLGLGPGLTPAGDDIVAGLLAMLVWQAQAGAIPEGRMIPLVAAIRAAAPGCTNRISARLLWHAGAGVLYTPAMAVGAALLAGDPAGVAAAAPSLLAIGHSSGADMACGLLAGLV